MELINIIGGLLNITKLIQEHNNGNKQTEIYKDLDNQSKLINELIQLSKQQDSSDAEDENMKVAKQLTDIAEDLKALTGLMNLVAISNSDDAKAYFINETLSHVLDSLCNSINDITNLSDSLVDLD